MGFHEKVPSATALFGKVYLTIFLERDDDLFLKKGSLCASKMKVLKITQIYFLSIYICIYLHLL